MDARAYSSTKRFAPNTTGHPQAPQITFDDATSLQSYDAMHPPQRQPHASYRVEIKPLHDLAVLSGDSAELRVQGHRDKSHDNFATADTLPPLDNAVRTRNWFMQSRVVDIRNQGQCGSWWAESATGVRIAVR